MSPYVSKNGEISHMAINSSNHIFGSCGNDLLDLILTYSTSRSTQPPSIEHRFSISIRYKIAKLCS